MYDQLVFYLEACESGSMFQGLLPDNINIYATTAANARESSYAAYCSPSDVVNGQHIGSCLGDLYSVTWMEDTELLDPSVETLETQFNTVLTETSLSHVMEYGQTTFKQEVVGDFQGDLDIPMAKIFNRLVSKAKQAKRSHLRQTFTVDSRNAKLASLYGNVMHNPSHNAHLELQEEITHRMKVDHIWEKIVGKIDFDQEFHLPRNFPCLKALVNTYQTSCGAFSDYSLKYVKFLVNECENLAVPSAVDGIAQKIIRVCSH
jgi:legumain